MKLDLAARREELLRERAKIEEQIAALRAEHEQSMALWQSDLRVIEARLEEIENFAAALGPDFSGRAPVAGGPVEPIRRGGRNSKLRTLTLDLIKTFPGNAADSIVQEILRKIPTSPDRVLNALAYWEARGEVEKREGEEWWPIETLSEGPQDTESVDGNHG